MQSALLQTTPLIVEQKRKFFELRNQYRIFDAAGTQVGSIEQEKQSALTFLARLGTDLDVTLPVRLTVSDEDQGPVLILNKPWFTMKVTVSRPDGTVLGTVSKRIRMGKARFTITDDTGAEVGEVRAENWRAKDFAVFDGQGMEVARVAKKWRGVMTEVFSDADTYALELTPAATEPLRSLALGAVLGIDLAMKQKDA